MSLSEWASWDSIGVNTSKYVKDYPTPNRPRTKYTIQMKERASGYSVAWITIIDSFITFNHSGRWSPPDKPVDADIASKERDSHPSR